MIIFGFGREKNVLKLAVTNQQNNKPGYSKAAVNEPPANRNAPEMASNKSKGNNQRTGDHTKLNDPDVFERVSICSYKKYGEYEMRKGQPIIAIH